MKNRKVKLLRMETGVSVLNFADTTLTPEKHKCEMELSPAGVLVKPAKGDEFVVPYSNVVVAVLFPEEVPPATSPGKSK